MDINLSPYDERFILEVGGQKVVLRFWKTEESGLFKIGIEAPRDISIARGEVFEKKEK